MQYIQTNDIDHALIWLLWTNSTNLFTYIQRQDFLVPQYIIFLFITDTFRMTIDITLCKYHESFQFFLFYLMVLILFFFSMLSLGIQVIRFNKLYEPLLNCFLLLSLIFDISISIFIYFAWSHSSILKSIGNSIITVIFSFQFFLFIVMQRVFFLIITELCWWISLYFVFYCVNLYLLFLFLSLFLFLFNLTSPNLTTNHTIPSLLDDCLYSNSHSIFIIFNFY